MTKRTCWSVRTSSSGLPSNAIRSAIVPGVTLPIDWDIPRSAAALMVAERMAARVTLLLRPSSPAPLRSRHEV